VTLRQAEALVGLPCVPGRFDCMHLAVLAQRVLFNRLVQWQLDAHPLGRRHQAALVQRHCDELADRLPLDEPPVSGDAVLWLRADGGYHIGTLLVQAGRRWVLHTSEATGSSVLQQLADTAAHGLRLEGFYRWHA
jgi:hypothetical protein